MVNIELTNKGFADVVTAMHDAVNCMEEGTYYSPEERDDIRSNLRNALALLVSEEVDALQMLYEEIERREAEDDDEEED